MILLLEVDNEYPEEWNHSLFEVDKLPFISTQDPYISKRSLDECFILSYDNPILNIKYYRLIIALEFGYYRVVDWDIELIAHYWNRCSNEKVLNNDIRYN